MTPIEDDIEILRRDFNSDSCVRIRPGMNRYESARHYLDMITGKRPRDNAHSICLQDPFDPLPRKSED